MIKTDGQKNFKKQKTKLSVLNTKKKLKQIKF